MGECEDCNRAVRQEGEGAMCFNCNLAKNNNATEKTQREGGGSGCSHELFLIRDIMPGRACKQCGKSEVSVLRFRVDSLERDKDDLLAFIFNLQEEIREIEDKHQSLIDFTKGEIGKLPKDYVKNKLERK